MTEAMDAARQAGADHLVFGDLFLGDVRSYREQSLEGTGITPLFPPWGRPTVELAADMLAAGSARGHHLRRPGPGPRRARRPLV